MNSLTLAHFQDLGMGPLTWASLLKATRGPIVDRSESIYERPSLHTKSDTMILGTPNSPSATRILFLGSGELGKEVVIEAMR
ncbi:MAG: hypothetical protein ACJAYU_005174, partial [Bradymonadia bacterium]